MEIKEGMWVLQPSRGTDVARIRSVHPTSFKWGQGSVQGITSKEDVVAVFSTEAEAEAALDRYRASRKWSAPVIMAALDRISEARKDYETVLANAKMIAGKAARGEP